MKRPVRTLIQVIAGALVLFGLLEIGLEILHHRIQTHNHEPITTNVWHYVIGGVLIPIGLILFSGSDSLAEQLTDDVDDDDDDDEEADNDDEVETTEDEP